MEIHFADAHRALYIFWPFKPSTGLLDFFPENTLMRMIIDESHGLHKSIDRCGTNKFPALLFQAFESSIDSFDVEAVCGSAKSSELRSKRQK